MNRLELTTTMRDLQDMGVAVPCRKGDQRGQLARELWKTVWRAERNRRYRMSASSAFEAVDGITDSMLMGHALDMTPRQIFDLIQYSRWLLSGRDAAKQQSMLQYKLACSHCDIGVGYSDELPF